MEDSEEITEEENFTENGRDSIIFLIDASAPMFIDPPYNDDEAAVDCPFVQALNCALSTMRNKIFTADYDAQSIVLFGTKHSETDDAALTQASSKYGQYNNCFVLHDLEKPEADSIRMLENLLENSGDAQIKLNHLKAAAADLPNMALANSFWLCSSIFTKQKQKQDQKHVYLFTNCDEPYSTLLNQYKEAERRAADLQDAKCEVHLFPIGESFNTNKFYKELLMKDDETVLPKCTAMDDLLSEVKRKSYKKRCLARLTFSIGNDIQFAVKLYNLVRSAPMLRKIMMDRRTNEPVKSSTIKSSAASSEEPGNLLLASELTKYTTVGGVKIQMNKEDIKAAKASFPTGITLLGFKPIDKLKLHLFISPASFIYPDDETIKGSRLLFGALLDRCKARNVAAICYMKNAASSRPRQVALLPQLDDTLQGFHVIDQPFMNDVRHLPYQDLVATNPTDGKIVRANQEEVDAAKAIIKKMTVRNFSPDMFENPALRAKWNLVEQLALGRDDVVEFQDALLPPVGIDERLGERAAHFNNLLFPYGYTAPGPSGRAAVNVPDDAYVEEAARTGRLEKMTVAVLKAYLISKGGATNLLNKKKADFIQEIRLRFNL